jgi:hypothetical protein
MSKVYISNKNRMVTINIVAIGVVGLLMLMIGVALYMFQSMITENMRYFLPIPPIAVASYVFTFNLCKDNGGQIPASKARVFLEIFLATGASAFIFCLFTFFLIVAIGFMGNSVS